MAADSSEINMKQDFFIRPESGKWPRLKDLFDYNPDKPLASGGFGVVYFGVRKSDKKEFALKVISKRSLAQDKKERLNLKREIELLKKMDHPRIPKLHDVFATKTTLVLVQDLLRGGDLFDLLDARLSANRCLSEREVALAIQGVLEALVYCHEQGIAHRDLKPENVMLAHKDDMGSVRLIDFGLARIMNSDTMASTVCGTPFYVSPEVIESRTTGIGYGNKCDIWSVGVMTHMLVMGYPPFSCLHDESIEDLFHKIRKGDVSTDEAYWDTHLSEECYDFTMELLDVDPNERPSAEKALQHPWFQKVLGSGESEAKKLPKAMKKYAKFSERSKTLKASVEFEVPDPNEV